MAATTYKGAFSLAFLPQTTPGTPGNPTFTGVTGTNITVNWTAASGAESYKVERAPDSGGSPGTYAEVQTGVTALSWSDTTVSCGTTYWYRVRATNTAGDGSYDTAASQATSACGGGASANSGMMGFLVEDGGGGGGAPTLAIDASFPNQKTYNGAQNFVSNSLTVGTNRLLAVVCAAAAGSIPTISGLTDTAGGAIGSWTQRIRRTETGTSDNVTEIWTAYTSSGASGFTITCPWSASGQAGAITVFSFEGANSAPGSWPTCGNSASSTGTAANCSITTSGSASIVIGGGVGWNATTMTAATSNTVLAQAADGSGNQVWATRYDGSIGAGTYTSGCSTTSLNKWSVASLEVQQQP
jgi:hypothetical protein